MPRPTTGMRTSYGSSVVGVSTGIRPSCTGRGVAAQWHDDAVLDELVGAEAAAAARVYDRAAAYLRTTPGEAAAQLQLAARRAG